MKFTAIIALFIVLVCTLAYAQDPPTPPEFVSLGVFADTATSSKSTFTAVIFPGNSEKYNVITDDTITFAATFPPQFKTEVSDVKCVFRIQGVEYKDDVTVDVVNYQEAAGNVPEVPRSITASFTYKEKADFDIVTLANNIYLICENVANADVANPEGGEYYGSSTVTISPKDTGPDAKAEIKMTAPMGFAPVETESLDAWNILSFTFKNNSTNLTYITEDEAQKAFVKIIGIMELGGFNLRLNRVYDSTVGKDSAGGPLYTIEYIIRAASLGKHPFPITPSLMDVTFDGFKELLLSFTKNDGDVLPGRILVDADTSYFTALPECFTSNDGECLKRAELGKICFPCQNKAPCQTDADCVYTCQEGVCYSIDSNSASTTMSFAFVMMTMTMAMIATFIF